MNPAAGFYNVSTSKLMTKFLFQVDSCSYIEEVISKPKLPWFMYFMIISCIVIAIGMYYVVKDNSNLEMHA